MEYTAVRYPTKEYRQYRPGSKGLNVHYKAFREQFYGNKAIIKRSFRDVNRNPSVGQYTDQRGIPTFAYKIPNGKMYKTAPLMARIPRGGSVPRVVGSLGDVQGQEFFTEGTYQPPSAPGQSLNSPFLFGKASQTLQDATAQYQAQTGKPVNYKILQSQAFKDFYSGYVKNTQEYIDAYNYHPENTSGIDELATEQSTSELNAATNQEELQLVSPAMQPATTTPDTQDTSMGNTETSQTKPSVVQNIMNTISGVFTTRLPDNLTGGEGVDRTIAENTVGGQHINDAGEVGDKPFNRIAEATQDAQISNPGPAQVNQSLPANNPSSTANSTFDTNTEQDIRGPKDDASTSRKSSIGSDKSVEKGKAQDDFTKARKLSIDKMNKTTLEGLSEINGYNTKELKAKLTEHGIKFSPNAKKEVLAKLLHAYYKNHSNYKSMALEPPLQKKRKKEEDNVLDGRGRKSSESSSGSSVYEDTEGNRMDGRSRRSSKSSSGSSVYEDVLKDFNSEEKLVFTGPLKVLLKTQPTKEEENAVHVMEKIQKEFWQAAKGAAWKTTKAAWHVVKAIPYKKRVLAGAAGGLLFEYGDNLVDKYGENLPDVTKWLIKTGLKEIGSKLKGRAVALTKAAYQTLAHNLTYAMTNLVVENKLLFLETIYNNPGLALALTVAKVTSYLPQIKEYISAIIDRYIEFENSKLGINGKPGVK